MFIFFLLDCECQPGESADDLWKSFEECILSPQCLKIPPARSPVIPETPKTPLTPLTPQTPVISQLQRSFCSSQTTQSHKTRSVDSPFTSTSEPRRSDVTTEQWCAGQSEHDSTHSSTTSHASSAVSMATGTPVGRTRKQVHFPDDSDISVVHVIVAWRYAYQAARKGPWEQYARDRAHFRRRIDNLSSILEPCLANKIASMGTQIQNS